ncbi:MAG: PstS family phosphate ABC transporter substrate-binding protein [Candidatus Thorarchaeota archaeon]|nr:PstS family phosphate ABC transporter substrate-binding protein [Candidatus Thorarchaeota archaeon]
MPFIYVSEGFMMTSIWKQKKGLLSGMIIGMLLGVGGLIFISPPPGSGPQGTIATAGSTTVYPLSQIWATEFHQVFPSLTVQPHTGGSGLGQSLIGQALIDIGASSAYPNQAYIDANPSVEILPVSADALGIVVNQAVNGSLFKLDCDMAVAIFQRNVTTWDDFSTVFGVTIQQSGPIHLFVRSDASGTTATFAKWLETSDENANPNGADYEWLLGHEEALSFPAGANAVDGNPSVASGVETDQQAIGYVGLAFIGELVAADLYNPSNGEWITPSIANAVKAIPTNLTSPGQDIMNSEIAGAYPIARLLFYLVNKSHLSQNTITFVAWCLVQGQRYVSTVGYVPINGTAAQSYSLGMMSVLSPSI